MHLAVMQYHYVSTNATSQYSSKYTQFQSTSLAFSLSNISDDETTNALFAVQLDNKPRSVCVIGHRKSQVICDRRGNCAHVSLFLCVGVTSGHDVNIKYAHAHLCFCHFWEHQEFNINSCSFTLNPTITLKLTIVFFCGYLFFFQCVFLFFPRHEWMYDLLHLLYLLLYVT